VRYSGSPLKYSKSEVHDVKSVSVIDIEEKGNVSVRPVPLVPIRDAREIKGTLEELLSPDAYSQGNREDYIFATVIGEGLDIMAKLNVVYPNVMDLIVEDGVTYDYEDCEELDLEKIRKLSPLELFREFYISMNHNDLTVEQEKIFGEALENAMKEVSE
jgi:exonuclease SbcD